ncbi:MAG TPA: hypothetical protein VJJ23_01900 [Candidatus Nanoarchaeia archaeon]|nr:hypothetical protein [Candidatus Nanoarchaeia archaeon]
MADLVSTGTQIISPLYTLWLSFVNILPGLIAAIIVLIIGYFIAIILGHVVRVILEKLRLDAAVRNAELSKAVGHTHWSSVLGEITKWYIFIIFLQVAIDLLRLGTLTILLDRFVSWMPNIIAAILIVLFGFAVAHYVELKVNKSTKMRGGALGGQILKLTIMIIAIVISLKQIGIKVSLLENLVLLVVGAIAVGIAIALGIGLGSAMKGNSQKWIDDLKKKHL